jgi:hypothetical protein
MDAQRIARAAHLAEDTVKKNEKKIRESIGTNASATIRLACLSFPERYAIVTTEKSGKLVRVNF